MLIPPPYLDLLDPLPAKPAPRGRANQPTRAVATALLAAATGAIAGGVTAWLVVAALS